MKIRQLLLALGLLMFSPFVFADEMGTGNPDNSTNEPTSSAEPSINTTSESEYCSLWQAVVAWFEQE
ncbi:MAG: hypothetical protein KY410_06990 [Proteobacteria bacterium]|nr:hypothetical protein [Pseudomonadota bacterium]